MAEISRRVGATAAELGLPKPSYVHLRRLIVAHREEEDAERRRREEIRRILGGGLPRPAPRASRQRVRRGRSDQGGGALSRTLWLRATCPVRRRRRPRR